MKTILIALLLVAGIASAETHKITVDTQANPSNHNQPTMRRGNQAMDVESNGSSTTGNCSFLVTVDRAVNSPRNEMVFTARDLGCGLQDPIQVVVQKHYNPMNGGAATDSTIFADAGGAVAGILNRGFAPYESKEILREKIPPFTFGRFDFMVSIVDIATGQSLQQTRLTVFSGQAPQNDGNPIGITMVTNEITSVTKQGVTLYYIKVLGHFVPNQPMYYGIGNMDVFGEFDDKPVVTSTDGVTALVPFPAHSDATPSMYEGRVWLMSADRSFSTVSPSFLF